MIFLLLFSNYRREEDSERSTVYRKIQTSEEALEHLEEICDRQSSVSALLLDASAMANRSLSHVASL